MNIRKFWNDHIFAHLCWIIAFLILSVIFLVSFRIGTVESVKDIINTALALGSLMLALVAIIQALISGDAFGRVIGELKIGVDNLKDPAYNILEAAKILTSHSAAITDSVKTLDQRLNSFGAPVPPMPSQESEEGVTAEAPVNTFGGNLSLLLCVESFKRQAPFNPRAVFKNRRNTAYYTQGYVAALFYTRSMEIEKDEDNFTVIELKDMVWLLDEEAKLREAIRKARPEAVDEVMAFFDNLQEG